MKRIPEAGDDGLCLHAHGQSPYGNMQVTGGEGACTVDTPFAQHCIGNGGGGGHKSMATDDQEPTEADRNAAASVAAVVSADGPPVEERLLPRDIEDHAVHQTIAVSGSGEGAKPGQSDSVLLTGRDGEDDPSPANGPAACEDLADTVDETEGLVELSQPVGATSECRVSDVSERLSEESEVVTINGSVSQRDQTYSQRLEEDTLVAALSSCDLQLPDPDLVSSCSIRRVLDDTSSAVELSVPGSSQEANLENAKEPDIIATDHLPTSLEADRREQTVGKSPCPPDQTHQKVTSEEVEEDSSAASEERTIVDSTDESGSVASNGLKSILKQSLSSKKHRRRVTFNETMTVYSEEFPAPRQEALRVKEASMRCQAFAPPLEYQDWEPFEPPAEYRDLEAEIAAIRNCGVSGDTPLVIRSLGAVLFEWFEPCPTSGSSSSHAFPMPREEGEEFVVHYNTDLGDSEDTDECLSPPPPSGDDEGTENVLNDDGSEREEEAEKEDYNKDVEDVKEDEVMARRLPPASQELSVESARNATRPSDADRGNASSISVSELSPPLKELALIELPGAKPAGDSWRMGPSCLNQPETDSDSSASSQDTMILMTTEESKRNEEHIRDSFRRYESLRCRILGDDSGQLGMLSQHELGEDNSPTSPSAEGTTTVTSGGVISENNGSDRKTPVERNNSIIRRTIEKSALKRSLVRGVEVRRKPRTNASRPKSPTPPQDSLVEKLRWLTDSESNSDLPESSPSGSPPRRSSVHLPPSSTEAHYSNVDRTSIHRTASARATRPSSFERSLDSISPQSSRERVLATMPIPPDVREWKIASGLTPRKISPDIGPDKGSSPLVEPVVRRSTSADHLPTSLTIAKYGVENNLLAAQRISSTDSKDEERPRDCKAEKSSDELEEFVEQYLDRIERIRKRYSLTEEAELSLGFVRRPSVRGIRPRFGSTTEILKQMQSQIQPPPLASPSCARSHVTWPYVDVGDLSFQQRMIQGSPHHHHPHPHRASMLSRVLEEDSAIGQKQCLRSDRLSEHVSEGVQEEGFPINLSSQTLPSTVSSGGAQMRTKKNKNFPSGGSTVSVTKMPASSAIACPVTKDERGAPEGASSSPKVSSDSLYPHGGIGQSSSTLDSPSKEGVIYYSLKV